MSDPVNHPGHYNGPGGMEAKDAMAGYFAPSSWRITGRAAR